MARRLPDEEYLAVKLGEVMREMNSILARIPKASGQPNPAQKKRLAELKEMKRQVQTGEVLKYRSDG